MFIIYGNGLLFLMGLAFLARAEPKRKKKLFYKSASYLIKKTDRYLFGREKIKSNMKALYPGMDVNKKVKEYYIHKISRALQILLWGNILALALYFYGNVTGSVKEGAYINRNEWKEGDFSIQLQAEGENLPKRDISLLVEAQSLSEEEIKGLADELAEKLPDIIKNRNEGIWKVTGDINLPGKIPGFPFVIQWESGNLKVLKSDGQVENEEAAKEGEPVNLTARLLYKDNKRSISYGYQWGLLVYPPVKSEGDRWIESILSAIEESKEESSYEKRLILPQTVQGIAVTWREKPQKDSLYLWLIVLSAAFIIFWGQDNDLHKKVKGRNQQLAREYPEFVSKLTLYMGAGMTVKNAWKRVTYDYADKESSALYEEMLVSCREFENGVAEGEVYLRFGRRLGKNSYRKMSGLLCNHLQKGNKNLLEALKEEADMALEERKNTARIIGEEMGTKLLFPIMLMLIVVMVIIMVPAYAIF